MFIIFGNFFYPRAQSYLYLSPKKDSSSIKEKMDPVRFQYNFVSGLKPRHDPKKHNESSLLSDEKKLSNLQFAINHLIFDSKRFYFLCLL